MCQAAAGNSAQRQLPLLQRGAKPAMSGHNGWNEIPSVIMIHQCMKELGASITILKEVALDLLTEKLLFHKLQS
jgi:hypothetical protein